MGIVLSSFAPPDKWRIVGVVNWFKRLELCLPLVIVLVSRGRGSKLCSNRDRIPIFGGLCSGVLGGLYCSDSSIDPY